MDKDHFHFEAMPACQFVVFTPSEKAVAAMRKQMQFSIVPGSSATTTNSSSPPSANGGWRLPTPMTPGQLTPTSAPVSPELVATILMREKALVDPQSSGQSLAALIDLCTDYLAHLQRVQAGLPKGTVFHWSSHVFVASVAFEHAMVLARLAALMATTAETTSPVNSQQKVFRESASYWEALVAAVPSIQEIRRRATSNSEALSVRWPYALTTEGAHLGASLVLARSHTCRLMRSIGRLDKEASSGGGGDGENNPGTTAFTIGIAARDAREAWGHASKMATHLGKRLPSLSEQCSHLCTYAHTGAVVARAQCEAQFGLFFLIDEQDGGEPCDTRWGHALSLLDSASQQITQCEEELALRQKTGSRVATFVGTLLREDRSAATRNDDMVSATLRWIREVSDDVYAHTDRVRADNASIYHDATMPVAELTAYHAVLGDQPVRTPSALPVADASLLTMPANGVTSTPPPTAGNNGTHDDWTASFAYPAAASAPTTTTAVDDMRSTLCHRMDQVSHRHETWRPMLSDHHNARLDAVEQSLATLVQDATTPDQLYQLEYTIRTQAEAHYATIAATRVVHS